MAGDARGSADSAPAGSAPTGAEPADLEALHDRAATIRVAVVGAGVGGLVAAREFAKLGMRVTVFEAGDRAGGAIRTGEVDGVRLDLGAESFATRGGHVRALVDDLGLGDAVVEPNPTGAWLAGLPGGRAAPLPKGGVLGIPVTPFAPDVRRVIGTGAAWRAYLTDRFKPVLTIGHAHSLGRLVRSRVGAVITDRLVAPVTSGVYSADPDDIDPDIAAPGLNGALTRTSSLFGAVDLLQQERRAAVGTSRAGAADKTPGSAVQGIAGGMGRLVEALVADLADRGVEVRTGAAVTGLARDADGWVVVGPDVETAQDARPDAAQETAADTDRDAPAEPTREEADAPAQDGATGTGSVAPRHDVVIVATDEAAARRLLAPHAEGLAPEPERPGPVVAIATLVLRSPELDAEPRGTGVLTVPGAFRAKALTHASAKWEWVREAAEGRHVVRVSFGSQSEAPATDGLADDEAADLALEQAQAMLGVPLTRRQLLGFRIERFAQSQPAATIGRREATRAARESVRAAPGIGAVGAWLAGTGLAQVVPDAIAEADRLRRAALWSDDVS